MAKLVLTIEAESAGELHEVIHGLARHQAGPVGAIWTRVNEASEEQLDQELAAQGLTVGEPQKRTRRTKAQIEADAAASVGSQLGQTSAEVASEERPTQAGPSASQESAAPDEASLKRQTQAALAAYMAAHDGQKAQEVLKTFQTIDGKVAMSVGQLQPKDYPAAIDALRV